MNDKKQTKTKQNPSAPDYSGLSRYAVITIGMLISTLGHVLVTVPYGIINGGVTSVSLVMHRLPLLEALPVNAWVAIIEVALAALSFFFLGREVFRGSVYCCVLYVGFFNAMTWLMPDWVYDGIYSFGQLGDNPVMPLGTAAELIVGAAVLGLGYFLNVSRKATTAGMDTLALIIHTRHKKIPVAYAMYAINIMVLLLGLWTYGIRNVIMGIIFAGIQSFVMNFFMKKFGYTDLSDEAR